MNKKMMDILYGAVALVFSLFCLLYLIPTQVKSKTAFAVGPDTFPKLAAVVIGASGLAIAVSAFWSLPDKKALLQREYYFFGWKLLLRQAIFVAAMVVFILLAPFLGFVPASFLFVLAMMYFFGSDTHVSNVISAAAFSVVVYLLFSRLFQVGLPSGLMPF